MKNDKISKREVLGWVCLWGLVASVFFDSKEANANEVPVFHDVHKVELSTVDLLTTNLYHESRGESDLANYLILSVIENRKNLGGRYGSTYEEVILKPKAFSWTGDGKSDLMEDHYQYYRLKNIVEDFLTDKTFYMKIAQGIDHYHKVGHSTNWDYSKLIRRFQVDNHVFYKHK